MVDYFTRRGERPLPINVGGIVTNPFTGLPYDYFQKDTTTPYPGWTSPGPSVGTFNEKEALDELARRDQPLPVDVDGPTYSSFSPPSRNAFPFGPPRHQYNNPILNQIDFATGVAGPGWEGGGRSLGPGDGHSLEAVEAASPLPLQQSGEQTSTVPIDPTNMIPQVYDYTYPPVQDQTADIEEYGLDPLVGGSFFSGPNQTGDPAIPGSGYLFSHPVLKSASGGPFSELGALSREGADWQKFIGPAMMAGVGSKIPGASILGLLASGLNKLGAYHQFNPAADSNLFADPETGRATWGTTDPGGSGSHRGTLNLYNMLQDFGGSYPNRQVQTPSRIGPTGEIPQYANARDLAYIMGRGDRPPPGLYTQQTPLGYQDFGEDSNVTNQEALNTYNRTGAGALLNEAGAILGPDAGYNETRDLAASMADDLQDQMDYSDQDWGDWI